MKKYLLLILMILLIPINVFAGVCEPNQVSISSIELEDISGTTIEKEEASIDNGKINLNLQMSEIGDKATYNIVVNNISDENYLLDETNFNISSDYLDFDIETEDGSNIVEAKTSKNVYLKVEYKNVIEETSYTDNRTIEVDIKKNEVVEPTATPTQDVEPTPTSNIDPTPIPTSDVAVPNTGTVSKTLWAVGVLVLSFVGIYFIKDKYGKCAVLLLGACLLVLISNHSFALVTCSISVESNVSILSPGAMFKTGYEVNARMKKFVNSSATYSTQDTTITNIARFTGTPNSNYLVEENKVSLDEYMYPIYMWYDSSSTTIYWYTKTMAVYYNPDSRCFYYALEKINSISNINDISSEYVEKMSSMFSRTGYSSTSFTLDLGDRFNTSNVTSMSNMFSHTGYNSTIFTLDLGSKFDTSNVTFMSGMFDSIGYSNPSFTLDLGSKFDTSNVTTMSGMFDSIGYSNPSFTLDLGSKFDTSNVTNMSGMFQYTGYNNPTFILRLGNKFDTGNVTSMYSMFYGFKGTTIYAPTTFVTTAVTSSNNMFYGCTNLVGGVGTVYDSSHVDASYAHIDEGSSNPGYFTDIYTDF